MGRGELRWLISDLCCASREYGRREVFARQNEGDKVARNLHDEAAVHVNDAYDALMQALERAGLC